MPSRREADVGDLLRRTSENVSRLKNLLTEIDAQRQLIEANTAAQQALYQFLSDLVILEQSIAYFPFLDADPGLRVHELEAKLQGACSE